MCEAETVITVDGLLHRKELAADAFFRERIAGSRKLASHQRPLLIERIESTAQEQDVPYHLQMSPTVRPRGRAGIEPAYTGFKVRSVIHYTTALTMCLVLLSILSIE